ncbi:Sulfotransferase domain protein [Streptomonospora litoralis]|uniref:Sulfotransferase domain protein n=1 Tax=Streptomonospora litoralis TaxID=2498135 RepID=A0A4P6Q5H3_9ACTN|nr:Sulfotransferase domain protein [Streptomonospora litoralis]
MDGWPSSAERMIIILGCPRSGTTLLQLMLHAHPRIAIPPETRFTLDVYRRRAEFGDLREAANRRRLAEAITGPRNTRYRDLKLDPQETTAAIVDGPPTVGSAVGTVFRQYAHRFGKQRWGDKRPGYYQGIEELARMFPNAQFVHLIRDGRDCVGSLKQMPWYKLDSYHAVSTWAESIDYGRSAARRLGPGTFYELRYEDLVADPPRELSALCEFLGEEFDPVMCEPRRVAKSAVPKFKTWHQNTRRDVNAASSGSWQQRLEPWEAALAETVLGGRLKANGYELSGAPRASAGHLARYAKVSTKRRLAHRKRTWRDRLRRLRESDSDVAVVTSDSGAERGGSPAGTDS